MDAAELQTLIDQLHDVLSLFRSYQEAKRFHNYDRASRLLAELREVAGPLISRKACMLVVEALLKETEGDESGGDGPAGNDLVGSYFEGMTTFLMAVRLPDKKAQELVDFCREATQDLESNGLDKPELQSSVTNLLANAQEGMARFNRDELDEDIFTKVLLATLCIGAGAVLLSVSVHTFAQLELTAESKSMFAGVGGTLIGLGATSLIKQVEKAEREGKEYKQTREEAKEWIRAEAQKSKSEVEDPLPPPPSVPFHELVRRELDRKRKQEKEERRYKGPEERLSADPRPVPVAPPESHYSPPRSESVLEPGGSAPDNKRNQGEKKPGPHVSHW